VSGIGDFLHATLPALIFLVLCSGAYYFAVCLAGLRFLADRSRIPPPEPDSIASFPPISILKPVDGADPDFYENIRYHALQDYPNFELLFGVADPADPALEAVERLSREFPHLRIAAFVCDCSGAGNRKVQRLERLAKEARFEFFLVNDSDIRVDEDYLREIAEPFLDPERGARVGLVTCPYRARPGSTFASLLESIAISAEFQSQILLTRFLERVRFALGATMLFRRRDLDRVGGFEALTPYLADDYQLGNRIAGLGLDVVIHPHPVEIVLGDDGWGEVWRRQLRWSRTVRACCPGGHFGLLFTQGTLWSGLCLVAALISRAPATAATIPAAVLLLRVLTAWLIGGRCMGSSTAARRAYLILAADGLSFAAWLGSLFARRVYWRNRSLKIGPGGRIVGEALRSTNRHSEPQA
jgi:ceramide glucosyltransferase